MKKYIIGLAVAAVLIAGLVTGCTGATLDTTAAAAASPATTIVPGDGGAQSQDGGGNAEPRCFVDLDHSGDWSAGDIALPMDGDTCYIPKTLEQARQLEQ